MAARRWSPPARTSRITGWRSARVDSDGIEVANDAIGRLSLVGQYLAQQLALAVVPALGKMAKAMTDSLRQGGLLRGILDAIVLAVKAVVGAINLVIGAFSTLRTVMDLPERSIRWLLGLGPTALQAQRRADQLTLAIGDQALQLNTLVASMGPGVTMSKRMALAKLEEARAIYASMEAMRQQSLQMVQSTHEWVEAQATIDQAQRNMARVVSEQKQFTYDRGAIDDMRAQLQAAVDAQQNFWAARQRFRQNMSPRRKISRGSRTRLRRRPARRSHSTARSSPPRISRRRLADTADGVSFASATSSAAEWPSSSGSALILRRGSRVLGWVMRLWPPVTSAAANALACGMRWLSIVNNGWRRMRRVSLPCAGRRWGSWMYPAAAVAERPRPTASAKSSRR